MLLSLMYHHINSNKYTNSIELIEQHFIYISQNYKTVHTGENYNLLKTTLHLVFDDAYFDFYHYIFPLLKKYNIKVVLAVPTNYIQDNTSKSDEERLLNNSKHIGDMNYFDLCTWAELKEMYNSGLVEMASHSVTHIPLAKQTPDIILDELKKSKVELEKRLGVDCKTFVYPYGSYNQDIVTLVKKIYKYDVAIYAKYNLSWADTIFRVSADDMVDKKSILSVKNKIKYFLRLILKKGKK